MSTTENNNSPKKLIGIRLPGASAEKLERMAFKDHRTPSALAAILLVEAIDKKEKQK